MDRRMEHVIQDQGEQDNLAATVATLAWNNSVDACLKVLFYTAGFAGLVAWASKDVSQSGVMGDATAATAEKGERWLESGATAYAEAIGDLCRSGRG